MINVSCTTNELTELYLWLPKAVMALCNLPAIYRSDFVKSASKVVTAVAAVKVYSKGINGPLSRLLFWDTLQLLMVCARKLASQQCS